MAIDNKTIETEKTNKFYIILVERDGVNKFISRDFSRSYFPCTVLLNKTKRFNTEELAQKFIDNELSHYKGIKPIKLIEVINTLRLL